MTDHYVPIPDWRTRLEKWFSKYIRKQEVEDICLFKTVEEWLNIADRANRGDSSALEEVAAIIEERRKP